MVVLQKNHYMDYWVYIIVILWALAMCWVVYEIVWKVRQIRFINYLRKLSDEKLSALYTERWLKVNVEILEDRLQLMQYMEIMRELLRRNLYTGKIVH